jgi:hypothetical protein
MRQREGLLLRRAVRRHESIRNTPTVDRRVGYHCLMLRKREAKPAIVRDELRASTSGHPERPIHPNIHEPIMQAIKGKNYVTLVMRDHTEESGEPHVYGQRDGHPMVLLYNGETDPTWQLVDVRDVAQVKTWLDEHFSKRELPPEYDPNHCRSHQPHAFRHLLRRELHPQRRRHLPPVAHPRPHVDLDHAGVSASMGLEHLQEGHAKYSPLGGSRKL